MPQYSTYFLYHLIKKSQFCLTFKIRDLGLALEAGRWPLMQNLPGWRIWGRAETPVVAQPDWRLPNSPAENFDVTKKSNQKPDSKKYFGSIKNTSWAEKNNTSRSRNTPEKNSMTENIRKPLRIFLRMIFQFTSLWPKCF